MERTPQLEYATPQHVQRRSRVAAATLAYLLSTCAVGVGTMALMMVSGRGILSGLDGLLLMGATAPLWVPVGLLLAVLYPGGALWPAACAPERWPACLL